MKVILKQDVPKVGNRYDIVEVSDGYARNYLIPKGLAMPVTEATLKQRENELKMLKAREERTAERMRKLKEHLESTIIEIKVPAGEGGRLHAAVTSQEIVARIKEQIGVELDRRQVDLEEPIHTVGLHNVAVRLGQGINATLKVRVIAESS
jgi:large subunit ribosomal protein L9